MSDAKMVLRRPSKNFTAIPNELLLDPYVSAKAKGIYCYIASRPDGWVFYIQDITNNMKDGLDSVRSALSELQATGWITRAQMKDAKGKFCGSVIEFYNQCLHTREGFEVNTTNSGMPEQPIRDEEDGQPVKPHREKPHTGEPHTENPTHSNTDLTKTDLTNKKNITKKRNSNSINLAMWEAEHGKFTFHKIKDWAFERDLDPDKVIPKIDYFRNNCAAHNRCYANFEAAFKVWFGKPEVLETLKFDDAPTKFKTYTDDHKPFTI